MKCYFSSGSEVVQECFKKYFNSPVQYGQHEDERAGEQFYHYPLSFVYVSDAMKEYEETLSKMKEAEHGKWMNFYRNDCLTNVKLTVYCLDNLRRYIRVLGDGSNFYDWEKQYVLSDEDRHIMLLATTTNQLTDEEL